MAEATMIEPETTQRPAADGRLNKPAVIAHEETQLPPAAKPRVTWGAVIAGAVVALGAQLLLALLGLGIGAATVRPGTQQRPFEGLDTLAIIWWLVTGAGSLFIGGWVAGRLSGVYRTEAALHGVVTWGLTAVLSFLLLMTGVGGLLGGAAQVMSRGATILATTENVERTEQFLKANSEELKEKLRQEAIERGDDIARWTAFGAFWSFFTLLLGAVAAGGGAALAAPAEPELTRTRVTV